MTTKFRVGQNVVAQVTAQGIKKGTAYNVRRVFESGNSILGIVVTYVLVDMWGKQYSIVNGHLLLKEDR